MERQQPQVSEAQNVSIWERPESPKRPEKTEAEAGRLSSIFGAEKEAGVFLLAPALRHTGS